jgi:hypothetical protein
MGVRTNLWPTSEPNELPKTDNVTMAIPPKFMTRMYVYPTTAATSHPVSRATWVQVCILFAMIAVLWGGISIHLVQIHNDKAGDATRDASNPAHAAEQSIAGMIAGIDQTLLLIRAVRAAEPQRFDIDSRVAVAHFNQDDFQLGIIDRHGVLQPSQHNAITAPTDRSDSLNFRAQLDSSVDGCLDPRISGAGCLNWWGETGRRGARAERHVRYCWIGESVSPGAPQGVRG